MLCIVDAVSSVSIKAASSTASNGNDNGIDINDMAKLDIMRFHHRCQDEKKIFDSYHWYFNVDLWPI